MRVSLLAIVTCVACGDAVLVDDTGLIRSEICDEDIDTSPPDGPDCLMGTLSCGDTVTGITSGGSEIWNSDFHDEAFCFVTDGSFEGAERIWEFIQPAESNATVKVEESCGNWGLSVVGWHDEDWCPNVGAEIGRCEGTNLNTQVEFFTQSEKRWLIGMDSRDGGEVKFRLSVSCD